MRFDHRSRSALDVGDHLHDPRARAFGAKRARTTPAARVVGIVCGAPRGPRTTTFASLAGTSKRDVTSSHWPGLAEVGRCAEIGERVHGHECQRFVIAASHQRSAAGSRPAVAEAGEPLLGAGLRLPGISSP